MASVQHTLARLRPRRRGSLALACCAAALVAAAATLGVRSLLYAGEPLPGVRVLGADLAGASRSRALAAIRTAATARLHRPVTVLAGDRTLTLRPERVLRVDAAATLAAARAAGRSVDGRIAALLSPAPPALDVEPVLRIRRRVAADYLAGLARLGRPPVSPRLVVVGTAVAVRPGRPGTAPQGNRLLAALLERVAAGERLVRLRFRPAEPPVTVAAAEQAARRARLALSAPVTLTHDGVALRTLEPSALARLLRFRESGAAVAVTLDRAALAARTAPLLRRFVRAAVPARFAVSGGRVSIVPSAAGAALDPAGAARAVAAAAFSTGSRTAELPLRAVEPELTTGEAHALGIRRRVSSFTTDMGTSSTNRIHNVHLMADYIDGTVIRPGEVFSFNATVGPRTTARGFLEGQMIVGSLLLPSIGGGVCQTATTLFNNAFELGLPILERHNHSFYISHYPLGRDATVSWGGPDFKFRNDLSTGLLIKASYTSSTLTFAFYGSPSGRQVSATTGPKVDRRPPKMSYAVDPYAPRGSVRVVGGSNQPGFDVTVFRTVRKDGKVVRRDSFSSAYMAVGPTTIYGPGRRPPGPYFVLPPTA